MLDDLLRYDKKSTFCLIDCETESLCLSEINNKPWQVGILIGRGDDIIREHNLYIKWPQGLNVSREAAAITNFNPDIIENFGRPPEQVLEIMDKELQGADFIMGHNILGFDAYIIQIMYKLLGLKPYNIVPKAIDTLCIARAIKLEIPYNKGENLQNWQYRLIHKRTARNIKCGLGALGKEFELTHDTLHDAANDLRLNFAIWNRLKYQIEI
jgi:DNA polymerase III alpha subunit (gram-positive type)